MAGPVEGIKVVELGVGVAGPAAGGILADWGADVAVSAGRLHVHGATHRDRAAGDDG